MSHQPCETLILKSSELPPMNWNEVQRGREEEGSRVVRRRRNSFRWRHGGRVLLANCVHFFPQRWNWKHKPCLFLRHKPKNKSQLGNQQHCVKNANQTHRNTRALVAPYTRAVFHAWSLTKTELGVVARGTRPSFFLFPSSMTMSYYLVLCSLNLVLCLCMSRRNDPFTLLNVLRVNKTTLLSGCVSMNEKTQFFFSE